MSVYYYYYYYAATAASRVKCVRRAAAGTTTTRERDASRTTMRYESFQAAKFIVDRKLENDGRALLRKHIQNFSNFNVSER